MRYNIIVGARPNFIKLWALLHGAPEEATFRIIHTGQHYDKSLSEVFFKELELPDPDVVLENTSLDSMVRDLKEVISNDPVIVFGDTRSALAGALAGKDNELIHIEAGLRSFDSRMPEETNRIVIDHLSHKLFTTEKSANDNLVTEAFSADRFFYVGNLMLETLANFLPQITMGGRGQHVVATTHRVENETNLRKIIKILNDVGNVILVLHPRTEKEIKEQNISLGNITVNPPMGYIDFMRLVDSSRGVITDSGGLQEEASYLGIPCATFRDNTERPSTLKMTNKLFSVENIDMEELNIHLNRRVFPHVNDFPDYKVSKRIFEHL